MIELGRALPSAGPRTGVADAHRDRQSADYSKPPQALPSSETVSPHGWGSGRQGRRRCIPVPGSIDSAGGAAGGGRRWIWGSVATIVDYYIGRTETTRRKRFPGNNKYSEGGWVTFQGNRVCCKVVGDMKGSALREE